MTLDNALQRSIPVSRIGMLYGYLVCLISLIVALVGLNMIASRAIDLVFAPEVESVERTVTNGSIGSFLSYKQNMLDQRVSRIRGLREEIGRQGDDTVRRRLSLQLQDAFQLPTDTDLREDYRQIVENERDATRMQQANQLAEQRSRMARQFLSGFQMLLTGAILFFIHWRWVQRRFEVTKLPVTIPT